MDTKDGTEKKRIYFGGIQSDKVKKQNTATTNDTQPQHQEYLPFSRFTQESQERKQQLEEERIRKSKHIILPTNDVSIKLKLRELGEPIILFGEKPEDRRYRLKMLCVDRKITNAIPLSEIQKKQLEEERTAEEGEAFLTEGTEQLRNARIQIAMYSLAKTGERIRLARERKEREDKVIEFNTNTRDESLWKQTETEVLIGEIESALKSYSVNTSVVGDERQLSCAVFSPDSKQVLTSGWSGLSKVWNSETGVLETTLTGHKERVVGCAYHPRQDTKLAATASSDKTAMLWRVDTPSPVATFTGHLDSVNRVAFHPMGQHLVSSSSDRSWKMWDLETKQEILDQEGHGGVVYGVAFHGDGSLLASGADDHLVRLWDLRSGRPVSYFKGHVKLVTSVDWSPDGYHLASGSEDNSVIIWDVRKRENAYKILSHASIVTSVKYQKNSYLGFLATCSFDSKIKLWSPNQWKPMNILEGHASKITSIDISNDNEKIVSSSFDKTWKIWSR